MRLVFNPYKNGCAGLRLIKQHLKESGIKAIELKKVNSKWRKRQSDFVINWGASIGGKDVQLEKLTAANVPCVVPIHRNDCSHIFDEGGKVVCRTVLNGHGGNGIVVASNANELVEAPLYVKYQKKQREFRVHVVNFPNTEPQFMVSEKKMMVRERRPANFNPYIRNHENGWVFTRENLNDLPNDMLDISLAAVVACNLSIGAVDVGWHQDTGCFIFEINTAPGADNTTAQFYAESFATICEEA